ncbi:SGNH/GDSL hydrolase family protein [Aphanothece sacrum]|nr:SGNH/GDSL hydrolase family protein [Aphanothece sacrum]
MKLLLIIFAVIFVLLILLEGSLRLVFGLGKRLIYIPDTEIGYLLAPNQNLRRFGKQIIINQYSMRSQPIEKHPEKNTLRLFLLGDSVANGAWWTDQSDTISTLISNTLKLDFVKRIEVLNASANSWGPRNQLAYLQRFGTFDAQIIILLLNTDDLFATAPTGLPVGRDRHYPNTQPSSAITELLERVFAKSEDIPEMANILGEKGDRVGINLTALTQIQAIATESQIPLLVAITPLKREVENNPKDYEQKARKRLTQWAQEQNIPLIDFLEVFQENKDKTILYRDHIHLSPQGNQLVSQTISQKLRLLAIFDPPNPIP